MPRTASAKIQVKDILLPDDLQHFPASEPQVVQAPHPVAPLIRSLDTCPPAHTPEVRILATKDDKECRARRARRKWTESETQDLLRGVQRHGVGKWKQILEDPTYNFDERTAVDLKDRYRISARDKEEPPILGTLPAPLSVESETNKVDVRSSPNAGITTFRSTPRRKRRAWTPGEDARLLQGIQKHGFQWTNIHDDLELGLLHRRATDLRDRIRNKYPEGYRQADTATPRSETRRAEKGKGGKKRSNSDMDNDSQKKVVVDEAGTKEREHLHAGFTLPSLTMDDMMDWDNKLPPLVDWEDLNM